MRVAKSKPQAGHRRVTAVLVAVLTAMGLIGSAVGVGQANAATYQDYWIDACGMPTNGAFGDKSMTPGSVKVQTWKRPGNTRTVILLDGMRAQYDRNGWDIYTNARALADRGVNVVMPVGGPASWYTDWDAPSNFNGQQRAYKWGCVIDNQLVPMLRKNGFAGKGGKYAIMGVSMGGGAAVTHAAQRRDLYYAAGSLSGYLFVSAPGMRTALRMAMLDVAPSPWNIDAMWGPPWSPRWTENDPFMLINRLQGVTLYVGAGNGFFGQYNQPQNTFNDLLMGTPLELLAFAQAKAFEASAFVQGVPVMSYSANGTHAWGYWQDMLWNAKARGFFN